MTLHFQFCIRLVLYSVGVVTKGHLIYDIT